MPTLAPPSAHHALETPRVLDLVKADVARAAALIAEADADTPTPSCPGWTLGGLAAHLGGVQRWATALVTRLPQQRIELSAEEIGVPQEWSAMPEWLAAGGAALVEALGAADPDAPCYSWGADQHVRWWLRRQLHETAIHRVDVELAVLGAAGDLEPSVAVDNIGEFLDNLPHMARFRPEVRELRGDGETIHLHATDVGVDNADGEWLITLEPHGFRWSHAHVKGAAAVRGPVTDLLQFVWGRRKADDPAFELFGDSALLSYWSSKAVF